MTSANTEIEEAGYDNVIPFPKKFVGEPSSPVEVTTLEELADMLLHNMILDCADQDLLFDVMSDDSCLKDLAMVLESIRAALYKHQGIPHPIQDLSETMFTKAGDGKVMYTATVDPKTE